MDSGRSQASERWRFSGDSLHHGEYQGRRTPLAKIKVFHDKIGNTLTVWFGEPEAEAVCEETGNEVILVKDENGNVIGFEKLNFRRTESAETPMWLEFAESVC
jgi:hypothetical protein